MTIKSIKTGWTGISALAGNEQLGDFESIATVTVGLGGQANIEFTSIPSTYQHLQIRGLHRNSSGGDSAYICLAQFNSDTAGNYSYHGLRGTGAAVSSFSGASQSSMLCGFQVASNTASLGFGVFVMDILDYKDTNKYKTIRSFSGADTNNTSNPAGYLDYYSGNWRSANAITSIKFFYSANNFVQYSHLALYGIRG